MIDKDVLRTLPESPGVYIMYSETGEVVYIGKSINLKHRVSSYFTSKNHSRRIQNLVNRVAKIDYIVVNNEAEALILEANLIKKHKPRYNILMKDSKFYPFVKMSKDDFPYINATRKYEPSKMFEYFGPYTDSSLPHKLVDVIQQVFKLRTCRKMPKKACLNYYIGRCSAPCIGLISVEEYAKDVENAKKVLKGEIDEVISFLREEMTKSSKELNFEKAAHLRDSIKVLSELESQKQFVFSTDEGIISDYIASTENEELVNFYLAHMINGKFIGKQSITFNKNDEENPIEKFLSIIYLERDESIPVSRVCVESKIFDEVYSFFKKIGSNFSDTVVITASNETDRKILEICRKNSELLLNEHSARMDMENKEVDELCRVLGIENVSVIDGFDVANYGDEVAVGASVRFIDGIPSKRNYRIFKIKTVRGQNDFGMIREIVYRRYKREIETGDLPDLIVIDGGIGQLNSAISSLEELGLNIPIISIAKQEEKIYTRDGNEIVLPRNSYALRLIQRIRDETHRFGNSFVRNLKSKQLRK